MNHIFNAKRLSTLLLLIVSASCNSRYPGPLSPEKSIESIELREGFKIESFATEPFVRDPVCMEFDEQGNIYVVEMPDYPYRPEDGKQKGRIIQLKDTNNDGMVDQSVVFADSLMEATSILAWKGGLIVTTAPHILYLKDTNGDGQADSREILFSGFFAQNSEAQITSLSFGVDNWIYAANNGQAGEVTSPKDPNAPPLSMSGADFRFRLDRNQFERTTGSGQFGQTLDDWGNRFITQNTLHIQHTVIPWRYWHRHPYLPSFKASLNVSDHELEMFQKTPPPYWRAERTARRNKDFQERKLDRVEYAEDHFTGASGGTVYAGDGFPKEYYGNIFTGDVAGNLVHRDVLTPQEHSPIFVASRDEVEKTREFLASTDPWFRPVNFSQGPDGYLYLIDYYRQHIETPVSIPDDLKEDMDFLNGSEYGRIYRIAPTNAPPIKVIAPDLQNKSTSELVKLLTHPSRWWRLQAQRLILERQDVSVVPELLTMFDQHEDPKIRLHALYALEGLNSLNEDLVKKAVNDNSPGIREHGLILSERYPGCLDMALSKIDDPSIKVAFQATLTIGDFHGEKVVAALAHATEKYGQDPWFQTAVLSSEDGSSPELLKLLITRKFFETTDGWKVSFLETYAHIAGSRNQKEQINFILSILSRPEIEKEEKWQTAIVGGLTSGIKKSTTATPQLVEAATQLQTDSTRNLSEKIKQLSSLYSGTFQPN
jgi:putative membrane-bound dehydrogenase-like protein